MALKLFEFQEQFKIDSFLKKKTVQYKTVQKQSQIKAFLKASRPQIFLFSNSINRISAKYQKSKPEKKNHQNLYSQGSSTLYNYLHSPYLNWKRRVKHREVVHS